jgi:hypothetical protein
MRSTAGWDRSTGANTVTIAIVDTGVDWNHPDLAANIWSNTDEVAGDNDDDDANGFNDDVRGWDFVDVTTTTPFAVGEDIGPPDNDPMDFYSHGTEMAGVALAVGNNGVGMTGMTWNCKIMPLKVGIAERDSGNAYILSSWISDAVMYAARNGAQVINLSLVDNNWPDAVKDAIDFAYTQGAVVVAAAGNHDAGFPTYPAAYDKVIGVAATDPSDQRSIWGTPQPKFFQGNASNYGTWVKVAAPGSNIHTTTFDNSYSTAFVSGLAALIRSLRPSLTNAQVMKIISSTADRVTSDKYIGTGRINVDRALAMTAVPTAEITSPAHEQVIAANVTVTGSAGTSYRLEYAQGIYPAAWTLIANSGQAVTNGTLGTWDVSALQDNRAYTLRLTVGSGANVSIDEKVVYIQKNVQAGWPRALDGTLTGGLLMGDIDGGADQEIVALTVRSLGGPQTTTDLHILKSNGAEALGWPKTSLHRDTGHASLADITGDGQLEILVSGYDFGFPNSTTRFHVFDRQGNYIPGWPQMFVSSHGIVSQAPAVGDLDNNGTPEIVFAGKNDSKAQIAMIFVYRFNGTAMPGWPKTFALQAPPATSAGMEQASNPCLVDLNNDGTLEIVVGIGFYNSTRVYAFRHDGTVVSGWPVTLPHGYAIDLAAGDIDANGTPEIVGATGNGILYVWNTNGTSYGAPWPLTLSGSNSLSNPVLADLNGDQSLEIIAHATTDQVLAFRRDGTPMPGWPKDVEARPGGSFWPPAVVGDIDGDGGPDVIQASADEPQIYAWRSAGTLVAGWPKVFPQPFFVAPSLGDLDNDGQLEMAVAYVDTVNIIDLGIPYNAQNLQWPMAGFDGSQTNSHSPPDIVPPTVAFTAPANGSTVSRFVTLSATATDNVRVMGVRFTVDGVTVDREDTVPPYSVIWNTAAAANGPHTLTAVSRDRAGNTATSTRTITLFNPPNVDFTPPSAPRGLRVIRR